MSTAEADVFESTLEDYRQGMPWSGIGRPVSEGSTVEQAVRDTGLDWKVKYADLWSRHQGRLVKVPGLRAVVRTDTGVPLGAVGAVHTLAQNDEAFAPLDVLVKEGHAELLLGGPLHGGRSVFMIARLTKQLRIADEDYDGYFFTRNGHDGRGGLAAGISDIRLACINQLPSLILRPRAKWSIKLRHTKTLADRIRAASRMLTFAIDARAEFQAVAQQLVTRPWEASDTKALMDALWPVEGTKIPPRTLSRNENRREQLWAIWNGADDLENIRGSAWGALQAVAEFSDHHHEFRHTKRSTKEENRMLAILDEQGSAANLKRRAFEVISERAELVAN